MKAYSLRLDFCKECRRSFESISCTLKVSWFRSLPVIVTPSRVTRRTRRFWKRISAFASRTERRNPLPESSGPPGNSGWRHDHRKTSEPGHFQRAAYRFEGTPAFFTEVEPQRVCFHRQISNAHLPA